MIGDRYPFLPIPIIPEHTDYFEAGDITIAVGHRVLNAEISAKYLAEVRAAMPELADKIPGGEGGPPSKATYREQGMSEVGGACIHIMSRSGDELVEHFRIDCFDAEPHYHYVYQKEKAQRRVMLDPLVVGDAQQWALDVIQTRLPEILQHVGAPDLAKKIDVEKIKAALPKVIESMARPPASVGQRAEAPTA